jgi:catechol 2,3-dioxygenase-like lactoylglutathione lyase family enzyme
MVRTHGLTHLGLAVRDPERSARFYAVFGCKEYYRDEAGIQMLGPTGKDVLALDRKPKEAGKAGGIDHFGFRLLDPKDLDQAVREAEQAGGKLVERGEFAPGVPYAYVRDPDGYTVEIWYE